MRRDGYNVGGEQSGHIILSDYATTGDGLVASLQILGEIVQAGAPASEVLHRFDPVPQLLKNVRFKGGKPLDDARVQDAIAAAVPELNGTGRLVIRPHGHDTATPKPETRPGGKEGGRPCEV